MKQAFDAATVLREAGSRATPGRIRLLEVLSRESTPLNVAAIGKKLGGTLSETTVYRALESLVESGIVRTIDLKHGHAHYELVVAGEHHHHAVCTKCGLVEDVEVPHALPPEAEARKYARRFASIDSYSLEFFGTCKRCSLRP